MKFVGIDLHKQSITVCVVDKDRKRLDSRTLGCCQTANIVSYFKGLGSFSAVIEATASYEWLWGLLEPLADSLVLAHPGKLRIIAESRQKSDRLDARVLAEFLALNMIPRAYRPSRREREHRALVRHRASVQQQWTRVKNQIRRILGHYNADLKNPFSKEGLAHAAKIKLSPSDRFVMNQLLEEFACRESWLKAVDEQLGEFAAAGPAKEQQARKALLSIPGVGKVITEVVLAELGDFRRFGSQKKACAYAGLAPGRRESAGKARDLPITKQGSRLLRWSLVQGAWSAVRYDFRFRAAYQRLERRRGAKRAIIAIARRLLGTMLAILQAGEEYKSLHAGPEPTKKKPSKLETKAKKTAAARQRRGAKAKAKNQPPMQAFELVEEF